MANGSEYSSRLIPGRPAVAVKPEFRSSYPHFGKGDAEVWEQWLADYQDDIIQVWYDVALGGTTINDQEVPEAMARAWKYDTAVKIDAVVEMADENLVCEVKPYARMGAIGQALGYSMLLTHEPLNEKPNTPTIITLGTTHEVTRVAEALGIRIDTVHR